MEALMWTLMLETAYSCDDPDSCIRAYGERVICCCTDQGTESLLSKAPLISISSVLEDAATALGTSVSILSGEQGDNKCSALEDEVVLGVLDGVQCQESQSRGNPSTELAAVSPSPTPDRLVVRPEMTPTQTLFFPNSMTIHGIKHICDNLVGSILPELDLLLV